MAMIFSVAPLHYLGQNYQNEVQHDILGDVVPLAPVSASGDCDVFMYAI